MVLVVCWRLLGRIWRLFDTRLVDVSETQSSTLWDLDVYQSLCTCVMGRNGVDKTTLMKCIMGEETTQSGSIEFAQDVELTKKKTEDRSRPVSYTHLTLPTNREV